MQSGFAIGNARSPASPRKDEIEEKHLHGFRHFQVMMPVPEKLHDHACDKAANRKLHYD